MTKPEVVEWLLKNGFVQEGKRKIFFYRSYIENEAIFRGERVKLSRPLKTEEWVIIWNGSIWLSFTDEEGSYDECGLDYVHIDEKGWLILENVWELKPKEEISEG